MVLIYRHQAGRTVPTASPFLICGFNESETPLPIDVINQPTSTTEQQNPWTILLSEKGRLIDVAEFLPAVQNREQRWGHEYRKQFHEVSLAECRFPFSSKPEDTRVLPEYFFAKHPFDELFPTGL